MSRIGNGTGPATIRISRERDFAIFDELPPEIRKALNESWFNRSAEGIRPQLATIGVTRAAALLSAGGACDQAAVREERRQAEEARRIRDVLGGQAWRN